MRRNNNFLTHFQNWIVKFYNNQRIRDEVDGKEVSFLSEFFTVICFHNLNIQFHVYLNRTPP